MRNEKGGGGDREAPNVNARNFLITELVGHWSYWSMMYILTGSMSQDFRYKSILAPSWLFYSCSCQQLNQVPSVCNTVTPMKCIWCKLFLRHFTCSWSSQKGIAKVKEKILAHMLQFVKTLKPAFEKRQLYSYTSTWRSLNNFCIVYWKYLNY